MITRENIYNHITGKKITGHSTWRVSTGGQDKQLQK